LFAPLIADLREQQTGFFTLINKNQFGGALGKPIDLFQWKLFWGCMALLMPCWITAVEFFP